jgi:hypothetical protein
MPAYIAGGETQAHRDLKRQALVWAQANGYRIAAAEVSLPNYRVRMDVAACRMERVREWRDRSGRAVSKAAIGATAIFECKASASDFVRDARSWKMTQEKLERLHARRLKAEEELKIHYPSIRNGDSLFQEFETLNFERPGYERYEKIIRDIRRISARLHANTKFDRLTKYGAANLLYVVAEPGILTNADLPCGWGLLERTGDTLLVKAKPHWHDVGEDDRLAFLQRIALAGTRCVNREHGIPFSLER